MPLISSFRHGDLGSGDASRLAKQDGVTYMVRVRRHQVEPSGGFLLAFPIWAFTRLRWQLSGTKEWSVETTRMRRSGLGGKRVASELFGTRSEAIDFAESELGRLRSSPHA